MFFAFNYPGLISSDDCKRSIVLIKFTESVHFCEWSHCKFTPKETENDCSFMVLWLQTDNNSVKVLVKRVSRELFYPVEESLDAACVVHACGVRYFRPS